MAVIAISIAIGAMLGGAVRIGLANWTFAAGMDVHLATLTANILGCALIGSVTGRLSIKPVSSTWQNFWQTGFCGGLTTLSLHSYDNFMLLKEHSWLDFSLYLTGTLVFCLMALLCAKTATERVCSRSQPKTEPKQPLP